MATYTLTPAQLKGAGIYNSFEIPADGGSFINTKSFYNFDELGGSNKDATSNSNSLSYLDNQANITLSCWFKTGDVTIVNNMQFLAMEGNRSIYFQSRVYLDGENVTFSMTINNTQVLFKTRTIDLTSYTWYNIVMKYDGSAGAIYLDGVEESNITVGLSAFTTYANKPRYFGEVGSSTTPYRSTNFALWNRALSTSEVSDVYNNGCPSDISSLNPNTWFKMDDATGDGLGTTLPDSGSNNQQANSNNSFSVAIVTDSPCP